MKQIRKKEEQYRKHAKKRAIQTLIKEKKNAKKPVWKVPIQNIEKNTPVDNEDNVDFQIETAGSRNDDEDVIYIKYVPPCQTALFLLCMVPPSCVAV